MSRQMKDGGVEWIGKIPSEWDELKLKFVVTYNDETLDEKTAEDYEFDYIDIGSVEYGRGIVQYQNMIYRDAPSRARRIVHVDDVIVSTVRTYLKAVANIQRRNKPQIVSTGFIVLRAIPTRIDTGFLKYAVLSESFICMVESMSVGISYPAINASQLVDIKIPLPELGEQRCIASYLDNKTAQIDAIIEKTRASIEEYKKLKQAIITQAVTKGVRGERKMKDSGIEWIGEIPEEWETPKTLQCLEMPITDGPHTTPELYDEGVPFVSAEAVSTGNGKINFDHIRGYISKDFYEICCKKYTPQVDDVYMIKSGATTGRVAIVDTDRVFTIWSPLAVFRANKEIILPLFLFYSLQADYVQKQVENSWSYGTQQNIGMRVLERIKLCLPPVDEQVGIVSYLERTISAVNQLIEKKMAVLQDLESYKKSLIYEYVTGKKEVPA